MNFDEKTNKYSDLEEIYQLFKKSVPIICIHEKNTKLL